MENQVPLELTPFFVTYIVFLSIFVLFTYIATGISLYRMGKNDGLNISWFAWVPILNLVLWLELIREDLPFKSGAGWKTFLIMLCLVWIPVINSYAFFMMMIWAPYHLYAKYTKRPILYFTLSVLPFAVPIILLKLHKRTPFNLKNEESK